MEGLNDIVRETYSRFTYKLDKGEDYRFLDDRDPITGDCEDFSLTVMRVYFGGVRAAIKALWEGRAYIWHCKGIGADGKRYGHAVGEISGRFFDNSGVLRESREEFPYVAPNSWKRYNRWQLLRKFFQKEIKIGVFMVVIIALLATILIY